MSIHPYRYPHTQMEAIETMVKQMMEVGLIRNSKSPYSSHVLLVRRNTVAGVSASITELQTKLPYLRSLYQ